MGKEMDVAFGRGEEQPLEMRTERAANISAPTLKSHV
jgi:hypothetical protein